MGIHPKFWGKSQKLGSPEACNCSNRNHHVLAQKKWASYGSSLGKESACNAGDLGSIPGWGRSPGEENGNPLQYSCL